MPPGQTDPHGTADLKQGALIGAATCFVLGAVLMALTLFSFMFYAPLFLASFVLSIVAMSQGRVVGGIAILLATTTVPPVMFAYLGATRSMAALGHAVLATATPSRGIAAGTSPTPDGRAATPDASPSEAAPPEPTVTPDATETPAPAPTPESTRLDSAWRFSTEDDDMGRGEVRFAVTESTEAVEFDFPYQGVQRARLTLRTHPKYGHDVILSFQRAHFMCPMLSGCQVLIRLDQGKAETFRALEPDDHSTNTIFIQGFDKLVPRIRKARTMKIEAQFFQSGTRVLAFEVLGLQDWPKVADPSAQAVARPPGTPTGKKKRK